MKMLSAALALLLSANVGYAQTALNEPIAAPLQPAAIARTPHTIAIEKQLRAVVATKYPNAEFKFLDNALVVRYRSAKFEKHLTMPFDNLSSAAQQFPPNFSEWIIRIDVENNRTYYGSPIKSSEQSQPLGAVFSNVYSVKKIASTNDDSNLFADIPFTSWIYPSLHKIIESDVIDYAGWKDSRNRPFTRYELLVMITRNIESGNRTAKLETAPQEVKDAISDLQWEIPAEVLFSPELHSELEMVDKSAAIAKLKERRERAENQRLLFVFAYGKGTDAEFVAQIKRTVADYAAANFAEDTLTKEEDSAKAAGAEWREKFMNSRKFLQINPPITPDATAK